jgi:hypothetical protein
VLCFKAPTQGKTYAELAMEYGSGALNVDGGRISGNWTTWRRHDGSIAEGGKMAFADAPHRRNPESSLGRYPANLVLECTCEEIEIVDAPIEDLSRHNNVGPYETSRTWSTSKTPGGYIGRGRTGGKAIRHTDPNCPAAMLDVQAGESTSGVMKREVPAYQGESVTGLLRGSSGPSNQHGGTGGPSRFFYCAKASRREREAGIQPEIKNQKSKIGNDHPTVKPLALCCWLATLLLPPDSINLRRLLVPFSGSGSEVIGALQSGWDEVVGIEQDAHYCEIAKARIIHIEAQPNLFEPKPKQLEFVGASGN